MLDKRIFEQLVDGGHFVELGCGGGEIIYEASKQYTESIGIDFSDVRIGRLNINSDWKFVKSDLNLAFPLEDKWADCIVANQVIEHIQNPVHFARESFRVLRPGGRIIVTTPNIRYIKNLWWIIASGYGPQTAGGNTRDGEWDDGHLHYFTNRDILDIFRSVGFDKVWSRALVNLSKETPARQLVNKMASVGFIREFLSGTILLVADKSC